MFKQKVISVNVTLLNIRLVFLLLAFVHLVVTAIVTLSIDTTVDDDPKVRAYYYVRWKLITCWFNLITLVYLPIRIFCDWKTSQGDGTNALVKQLNHVSDAIFTGILFPIVVYSDVAFWIIYNTDPTWLGPTRIFDYLPYWAQHSLHTVSFLVVVLDMVLTPRVRPNNLKPRFALLLISSFAYILTVFSSYSKGEMVYQCFEVMSIYQLMLVAVLSLATVIMLFAVEWVAIDYLWGSTLITKIS